MTKHPAYPDLEIIPADQVRADEPRWWCTGPLELDAERLAGIASGALELHTILPLSWYRQLGADIGSIRAIVRSPRLFAGGERTNVALDAIMTDPPTCGECRRGSIIDGVCDACGHVHVVPLAPEVV